MDYDSLKASMFETSQIIDWELNVLKKYELEDNVPDVVTEKIGALQKCRTKISSLWNCICNGIGDYGENADALEGAISEAGDLVYTREEDIHAE